MRQKIISRFVIAIENMSNRARTTYVGLIFEIQYTDWPDRHWFCSSRDFSTNRMKVPKANDTRLKSIQSNFRQKNQCEGLPSRTLKRWKKSHSLYSCPFWQILLQVSSIFPIHGQCGHTCIVRATVRANAISSAVIIVPPWPISFP